MTVLAEGPAFHGHWIGAVAEPAWKLRFTDGAAEREIAVADLVLWGAFVEPAHGIQIVLAGGGLIETDTARIENDELHGESPAFGKLNLPLTSIAAILLRPPHESIKRDFLLARVASPGGQTDRALLDNGDELTGTINRLQDDVLQLQTETGKLDVEVARVAALIFNPTLLDKPAASGLRVLVGLRDGSHLTAIALVADGKTARLKLAGGVELRAATDAIVALQPLGGRATYLSDLKPASYRHIPYLQLTWPFAADRSVQGARLRAGGKLYAKGLGMHSPARITFDLDRPYRRFESEAAIDAEAGTRGSVVFRVFTDDGSGTWQQRAASDVVRGGQSAVPISVELEGARRFSLLVDFADRGDEQDHADWLNARLVE